MNISCSVVFILSEKRKVLQTWNCARRIKCGFTPICNNDFLPRADKTLILFEPRKQANDPPLCYINRTTSYDCSSKSESKIPPFQRFALVNIEAIFSGNIVTEANCLATAGKTYAFASYDTAGIDKVFAFWSFLVEKDMFNFRFEWPRYKRGAHATRLVGYLPSRIQRALKE